MAGCRRKRSSRVSPISLHSQARACSARRFRCKTTDSGHALPVAENVLNRQFDPSGPNQAWLADITYIPIGRGFLYLVAVTDWASRAVLAWRLSNTMDVSFCLSALEEALAKFGRPEIFNTDQGSQFTSSVFTDALAAAGIRISMDGRGRWMDNVFIERLWRSLKYECVYLHAFEAGSALRAGLLRWINYYNARRPHSAIGGITPDEAYETHNGETKLAA